jgi:hypothetical protein
MKRDGDDMDLQHRMKEAMEKKLYDAIMGPYEKRWKHLLRPGKYVLHGIKPFPKTPRPLKPPSQFKK